MVSIRNVNVKVYKEKSRGIQTFVILEDERLRQKKSKTEAN